MEQSSNFIVLVKRVTAVWLCFHLVGVACNPNLTSFTAQRIAPVYNAYMNGLGFGGLWAFFAPEPFAPPVFIDYTITVENEFPISGRFPDENETFFFQSSANRRGALSRFLLSGTDALEYMFMNHICHSYPKAISAKLWSVQGLQPDYNMVRVQGKPISKSIEYRSEFAGEFVCKNRGQK